ncbi:MAG: efflux transporter outer membrane subunit [Planctomycetota bacterium]|jgi:NodT family efflux transporter outer membrane factor (OMF) lipoprotein
MKVRNYFVLMCIIVTFTAHLFLFSGCQVGPDYVRPEYSVPDQWHQKAVQGLQDGSADLQTWWKVFNDPVLENLIHRSCSENLNLQIAYARVMESRAMLGVASGQYWPNVDAVGNYSRSRASENGLLAGLPVNVTDELNLHSVGIDSSWEIDVFGRISRSVESAQASMEASIENYRDVLVSLYSQVALSYIDMSSIQTRIRYAQNNIKLQQDTLELTRKRREADLVPELDVQQAELVLASTESTIPALRQSEAQAIHRLSVLLGQPPAFLYEELLTASNIPDVPKDITVGLPAELLRQRPDIRRAERVLAAQTAEIGVATAGLYPAFSLSGTFALEAQQIDDIGDWDSRTWGFGPSMRWNLFDGDRIRSSIKVQQAQAEQVMVDYERTILLALEEVENSMVAFTEERQRVEALERSVSAAQKSVELVKSLYEIGLTDFQNVLDMQRALTTQQDQLAQSEGRVAKNLVSIYTALGGGWFVDIQETSYIEQ